jgi:hypothetical protein
MNIASAWCLHAAPYVPYICKDLELWAVEGRNLLGTLSHANVVQSRQSRLIELEADRSACEVWHRARWCLSTQSLTLTCLTFVRIFLSRVRTESPLRAVRVGTQQSFYIYTVCTCCLDAAPPPSTLLLPCASLHGQIPVEGRHLRCRHS